MIRNVRFGLNNLQCCVSAGNEIILQKIRAAEQGPEGIDARPVCPRIAVEIAMAIISIIIAQSSRLVPIGQARNAGLGRPYDTVLGEHIIRVNMKRCLIYDDVSFDGNDVVLPGIAAIFMNDSSPI